MCAILGIFNLAVPSSELRTQAVALSKKQQHRGPDWSGVYEHDNAVIVHERLAIVDVDNGSQPLYSPHEVNDKKYVLAVNGEIYNHKQLTEQLEKPHHFTTHSDCEVLLALYKEKGTEFLNSLEGMFAFILYDEVKQSYFVARDPVGIIPLYIGHDDQGQVYIASEMKTLVPVCSKVEVFPPGHYMMSHDSEGNPDGGVIRYYHRSWQKMYSADAKDALFAINTEEEAVSAIKEALTESVKSHLMTDVPYGVLLSGGLDSSVVAAIAKQFVDRRIEDDEQTQAWWPQLHTFAVGLDGAPDLEAAQCVADRIGTIHHTITYSVQEGIDALSEVIYHLETYDVTTIRASVPMYLMARKIRAMGIKMILSGEGSDELFGGYLYFHKAPSPKALYEETLRKLEKLNLYDCLRANKSMMAWSIEARVPFLGQAFMDVAMQINPALKMSGPDRIEKYLLRKAFEDVLPASVTWRQKEQFSDGVGYSWIDSLQAFAAKQVSDRQLSAAENVFSINTPQTKEAYLYRAIFEKHFPLQSAIETVPGGKSVACSTPEALAWDKSLQGCIDPSGRAVGSVHNFSYDV